MFQSLVEHLQEFRDASGCHMQEAYLPNVEAVYNSPEATSKFQLVVRRIGWNLKLYCCTICGSIIIRTTLSLMSAKSTLVIFNLDPIILYNHSAMPLVFVANVVVQSSKISVCAMSRLNLFTFAFSVGCRCAIGIATK